MSMRIEGTLRADSAGRHYVEMETGRHSLSCELALLEGRRVRLVTFEAQDGRVVVAVYEAERARIGQAEREKGQAMMSDADRVQRQYERLIGPLRQTARENGYALAVHGSLQRDIDLVALAWTEEAAAPEVLVDALLETAREITGEAAFSHDPQGRDDFPRKPHGRLAWPIIISGGSYIDLSVIGPQVTPDPRDAVVEAATRYVTDDSVSGEEGETA